MQKLPEADNYCVFEKAKPSHYEYVMNHESPSTQNYLRLNLPICIVQIIISSWGQSLDDAFPALGFIPWLQDHNVKQLRGIPLALFWLFSDVLLLPAV